MTFAARAKRRAVATRVANQLRPIEKKYVGVLGSVARAYAKAYASTIEPHLAALAGEKHDAAGPKNLANDLNILGVRVQLAIQAVVGGHFDRMAGGVSKATAAESSLYGINPALSGQSVKRDIARARDANIKLVEDAHRAYAQQVRELVGDPQNLGMRVEELRAKILERGNVSVSRAELIARDQTLKLHGQITATRQTRAGVQSYTWSTSRDERVRDEHAALEGQTFSWNSPPEPGHPGEDFQCRCVAIPNVEELDDVFGASGEEETPHEEPEEESPEEPEPLALPDIESGPEAESHEEESITAGTHVETVDSSLSEADTRDILSAVGDPETRAALAAPGQQVSTIFIRESGITINGDRVDGGYNFMEKRLELAASRPIEEINHPWAPGKTFKVSAAASTVREATKIDLRHELGHHWHLGLYSTEADQVVNDAYLRAKSTDTFITRYAQTNRHEYFAESYAAYYHRHEDLNAHDPNGFAMVERVLQLRGIKK